MLAVEEVPDDEVSSYGVIEPEPVSKSLIQGPGLGGKTTAGGGPLQPGHCGKVHTPSEGLRLPGRDYTRRQGGNPTNGRTGQAPWKPTSCTATNLAEFATTEAHPWAS